jgi:hypothetical protein
MIASWIGGAVFWCDIHLLMERREGSGYKLIDYLSKNCVRDTALNGHYDVIKYLCKVGFPSSWESWKLFSWKETADK